MNQLGAEMTRRTPSWARLVYPLTVHPNSGIHDSALAILETLNGKLATGDPAEWQATVAKILLEDLSAVAGKLPDSAPVSQCGNELRILCDIGCYVFVKT